MCQFTDMHGFNIFTWNQTYLSIPFFHELFEILLYSDLDFRAKITETSKSNKRLRQAGFFFFYPEGKLCLLRGGRVFIFFYMIIYSFKSRRERRERILYLIVHSPKAPICQGWARLKPKAWNCTQLSHVGGRYSWAITYYLTGTLAGGWMRSRVPRTWSSTSTWDVGIPNGSITHCTVP